MTKVQNVRAIVSEGPPILNMSCSVKGKGSRACARKRRLEEGVGHKMEDRCDHAPMPRRGTDTYLAHVIGKGPS